MKVRVILDMFKSFIRSAESCSSAVNKSSKYEICFIVKAPAHFHDVTTINEIKFVKKYSRTTLKSLFNQFNAPRPLSQCYLRSYLVKNAAGAHKERSKKYKSNLRTLKSKSYEQCRTKHQYYNNKAPHFLTAGLQLFPI